MNFSSILSEIERLDPEVYERTSQRRSVIKNWGRKIALAAVPFAVGSLFKKAYGKGTATIIEVLNYALILEYLESEFYRLAQTSPSLAIPTFAARSSIHKIGVHENQHVAFLRGAIAGAGGVAISMPTFDFTGGKGTGTGPFAAAFSDYNFFLAVAQTLEDTGVRAYKGAVADLMSNNDVLTAALNIHSVEARHASHIRQMRRAQGVNVKPWITGNKSGIAAGLVELNYAGEENTSQGNMSIVNIGGQIISSDAASEAFDEPLTMAQVLAIVDPFLA